MKPTPPPPEVASMKRPRTATRSSASKRKVLMDDPMVLHGEYVYFLCLSISSQSHISVMVMNLLVLCSVGQNK